MSDYVSRQYLLNEYDRQHQGPPGGARKIIAKAPAADVVQVVRCKDCKEYLCSRRWCELMLATMQTNDFCSYGEKRED